jgi:uncharacterized membrane protein
VPDAADRILSMVERQDAHRIRMEAKFMSHSTARAWAGLAAATVICIFGLWIAYQLGLHGQPGLAGVLGTLDFGGLVTTFIYGTNNLRAERRERAELMTGQRKR